MSNTRFIFGYTFFLGLALVYFYMYGSFAALGLIGMILIYSLISYILYRVWKYIRKNIPLAYSDFFHIFIYKLSLYFTIILGFLVLFTLYHNEVNPAKLPQYTLSNGEQTIIFQTMSHIASDSFYDRVVESIYRAKKDDFVLYFEGVQSGSEENNADFNSAMGIQFDADIYDNFSKLYGVTAQDNDMFLGLVNNLDYNIDISIDDIMEIYNARTQNSGNNGSSFLQSDEVIDINEDIIERLSELGERELMVLRYVNQSILNFIIKHENVRDGIMNNFTNQDIFSVILDDRNLHIVEEINARSDEKIFILYGMMHFEGVFEILKNQDSNWVITSTENTQLITRSE